MSSENIKLNILKNIGIGLIASFAVTLIVLVLFAVILGYADIDSSYAGTFSSIALAIGAFFGGFLNSRKQGEKGLLSGSAVGASLFLIITLISLIVDSDGVSIITLLHAAITIISGALGGILGVNTANKRKF